MRRLDPSQIREEFNLRKQKFADEHAQNGLMGAIEELSRVIGDLKNGGLDVDLSLYGASSEQAFAMFPNEGGLIVPVTGILRLGPHCRRLAIATSMNKEPVLKLAISEFDYRGNGAEASFVAPVVNAETGAKTVNVVNRIRALMYDLKGDPEALVKFQSEVIRYLARNAVINDHDVADAFDNGDRLGKPALKALPKP